jgi:lysophospholipase L1-like esterase
VDPIDYLLPRIVPDDFLLHRVEGYSGGHDAWGFRNTQKPDSAEIVCIGDSMTYGISATAHDSWPAVLGEIRHASVYNMSLGGYGPIQYLYLMRTKAVELHPRTVIIGFYFGNDFLDVYNEVRFNKNWSSYGNLGAYSDEPPAFAYQALPPKFLGALREWLSRYSVIYAILTRTPVFDFIRRREMASRFSQDSENLIAFHDDRHNEVFNLSPNARFLDLRDPRIKSAMAITKKVISDMRDLAEIGRFRLVIALIPTKERVYGKLLDQAGYLNKYPRLRDAVDQEAAARSELTGILERNNIDLVDLLPELEAKVEKRDLYPLTDGHPNKDGYRVIAETISQYLNRSR